ncbi:unnamed protein product [Rotaria sp. Silwood2]|nr:unnamed protein product [Rotaria sp. Silwood2]CAF4332661.1 unnamed protein product [Rotaria sp. Silwood2]
MLCYRMLQQFFAVFGVLSFYVHYTDLYSSATSQFEFTEDARAALCPFVGTEGMTCFDGEPVKRYGRQYDIGSLKLPRGVGISVDRNTGRLMALAVQLTYPPEGSRTWTDGFTGEIFDIFNEAILGSATRVAASYDTSRVHIFQNASQLNAAWQQTFADGKVRGGELACPPDLLEYMNNYFNRGDALVLSQRVIGLYTLTLNASAIQLNSFARRALSTLTATIDPDLYDDFVNSWGTHIITRSLVGGMVEERAKTVRCLRSSHDSLLVRCMPFWDQSPKSPACVYYADQTRVVSKRRLGGNVEVDNDHEWKRTLAVAPALLQILEMVPWYDFVTDEAVKQNLRTVIQYRQRIGDMVQAEGVHQVDARLSPCYSGTKKLIE